jgi:uncharacterized membrane protein YeaQ/YmgE (transglycosylase-associated protein family)
VSTPASPPRRPGATPTARLVVTDVVVVLLAFLVAGTVAGLVWPELVDPVTVTRDKLGVVTRELALSEQFDNDGWYAVLAAAGGLVLGVVLTAWRRTNEVVTLVAVVAGACLAAWVSAQIGLWRGPADPNQVLAHAKSGATALDRVKVSATGAYFVWPIAAVVGALVVLWSPPGRRPGRPERSDGPAETSAEDATTGS